ncbi:MAG: hypothetical protein HYV42_02560 [Candidatus Magasanikbacteria bacterium]|nr:hypothetical protein [Candidatus Magasanikbacteria bacterium]
MSERKNAKEHERVIDHCLIFDVDGVLTDPQTKEVTDPAGLTLLAERLRKDEPIILNTGRAVDFILEKIMPKLSDDAGKDKLKNVLVVAEKGGVVLLYNDQGEPQIVEDKSYSVPEEVHAQVKELVAQKYGDTMFYDATKRTMLSVEMIDNGDLEKFGKAQERIIEDFKVTLTRAKIEKEFVIDPTIIATDIQHRDVGKALGVRKALRWLGQQNVAPKEFLTFGDSTSDLPMAAELAKLGKPGKFIFVGEPQKISGVETEFPIVQTSDRFEQGVKEFLQSLNHSQS